MPEEVTQLPESWLESLNLRFVVAQLKLRDTVVQTDGLLDRLEELATVLRADPEFGEEGYRHTMNALAKLRAGPPENVTHLVTEDQRGDALKALEILLPVLPPGIE